jgi:hypothetical protein
LRTDLIGMVVGVGLELPLLPACAADAHADRLPGRSNAAGEPEHAAGMPGRRPRTADTPWMGLRTQKARSVGNAVSR